MRHLDEGLLSALYDGELAGPDQREAEGHLQRCEDCRRRYEELRELASEADRLIPALDEGLELAPPRRSRIGRYRVLAWAATIVITLGLGLTMRAMLYHPAVTSSTPGAGTESGTKLQGPAAPVLAPSDTPADSRSADPVPERRQSLTTSGETGAPPPDALGAAREASEMVARDEERVVAQAPEPQAGAVRNELQVSESVDSPKLAAKGFRESDARADAAAGAAAELNRARPAAPAAAQFLAFRPITLDSATILLGRRVQQVEGLTPEVVEVTGAEPGARGPMVRIRYRVQSQEVVLDQWVPIESRALVPGSARGQPGLLGQGRNSLQWNSLDGVVLVLSGSLPAEVLDQLRSRVR